MRCTALAVLILGVGLAGCSGHGKYTTKHKNNAEQAMAAIKSSTEYDMAHQAFLSGDLDKALKKIDLSIAINESVPKSHVLRGRVLMEMGSLDKAIDSFAAAEALEPENIDAHYYQGFVAERIFDHEEALDRYTMCVELDDTNPQYAVAAAEVLIDLDRPAEARSFLQDLSSSFEHHPGVAQTLGHIAMIEQNYDEAVLQFDKARLLAPENQAIQEELATALLALGRFGEADTIFEHLLDQPENEGRRDLLHMHARSLTALDRPVDAREIYLELTEASGGKADAEAWIGLGNVSYKLRDFNTVRRAAQRTVALAPNRHEGYLLQSLWQMQQGRYDSALGNANNAIRLSDKSLDTVQLRAIVLVKMEKYDDAERTLAYALERDPGNPSLRRLMSSVQGKMLDSRITDVPDDFADQP